MLTADRVPGNGKDLTTAAVTNGCQREQDDLPSIYVTHIEEQERRKEGITKRPQRAIQCQVPYSNGKKKEQAFLGRDRDSQKTWKRRSC